MAKQFWRYIMYVSMTLIPLLVGWGLDDPGGLLRDPARAGYVGLAVFGSLSVFVPRLNVQPFGQGSQVVGRNLTRAYLVSGIVLLLFLPFADRRSLIVFADIPWVRWMGVALALAGSAVRVAGLWSLGRQFSGYVTLQQDHELVKWGIYRLVRHPMYLGAVVATTGLGLVFRSWLVFAILIWNLVFVLLRIGQEERLLGEHFGAEFETYCRHTWRLFPYVY
jgi:protein-S-isoprenylcysteine O-methyltransferase Ste14